MVIEVNEKTLVAMVMSNGFKLYIVKNGMGNMTLKTSNAFMYPYKRYLKAHPEDMEAAEIYSYVTVKDPENEGSYLLHQPDHMYLLQDMLNVNVDTTLGEGVQQIMMLLDQISWLFEVHSMY
jgi:hypothetical protein